jgi:uncharacterized protein involved in exopolysaccharide biosynthesis
MKIPEILRYLRIVRKWWWVVTLFVAATVGTLLVLAYLTEANYEATVTMYVSAPPPQEVPLYSKFGQQALRDEIEQTRISLNEFLLEGDVAYGTLEALPDVRMSGSELRKRVTIDLPDNSQLVHVKVRASDPETAALLANTLVETGLKQYGQLLAQPTASTRRFIEQELEAAREELATAEAELIQFQIDNKIGDLNKALSSQYELIRSLRLQGDLANSTGNVAQAQALEETILKREAELQNMIALSGEYTELVDGVERVRATHNFLLDKRTEAQIKENQTLESGSIQIITPARPPRKPVAAIDVKFIVLGAVASVLLGVLLVFLLEYLEISGVLRGSWKHTERSEITVLSDNTVEQSCS